MEPPPAVSVEGSGHRDARVDRRLVDVEGIIIREGGVVDVALASRRRGAVERAELCGVRTDCLQDVKFIVPVLFYLFVLLLYFYFHFHLLL
jgi:hypothetical protein